MANLTETATWDDGIFQIETTTPLLGGEDGPMNKAQKQLANRTKYLKQQHETLENEVKTARGSKATLNERISSLEKTTLQGDFSFNGTTGVTISHSLGNTNYIVNVAATAATNGDLGDIYISKAGNAFTVYNTGGYCGTARYQIMN